MPVPPVVQYFGTAAAASARTPPAVRVMAALHGGLFRSAAPLSPAHISTVEALELLHQDHVVFVDTRDPGEVASTGVPQLTPILLPEAEGRGRVLLIKCSI